MPRTATCLRDQVTTLTAHLCSGSGHVTFAVMGLGETDTSRWVFLLQLYSSNTKLIGNPCLDEWGHIKHIVKTISDLTSPLSFETGIQQIEGQNVSST